MDTEIGRVICTHVYGILRSVLKPKERLLSTSFLMIVLDMVKDSSYREAIKKVNNIYHRDETNKLKVKTIADKIESMGENIDSVMDEMVDETLKDNDYCCDTGMPLEEADLPKSVTHPAFKEEEKLKSQHELDVHKAIEKINKGRDESDQIKGNPIDDIEISYDNCVYICIDDVGVNHQKESRKEGYVKETMKVEHTDIHIEHHHMKYSITQVGMDEGFRRLVAFLLKNNLFENKHLIFMTDGAQNLRKSIDAYFSYCPHKIILDWFHIKKHCYETMSMAIKGDKDYKHDVQGNFNRILWVGNIEGAIAYLKSIDVSHIKSNHKLQETIDYLKRKEDYVVCYALRKEMGLPNSSNPVEKDNDLNVAKRQKHNGMAWSNSGSDSLAKITVLFRNNEINDWLKYQSIPFSLYHTNPSTMRA